MYPDYTKYTKDAFSWQTTAMSFIISPFYHKLCGHCSESHSDPGQTWRMKLFAKIFND